MLAIATSTTLAYSSCARGFAPEVTGEPQPDGSYPDLRQWIARKGEFYFCADNPIELLGLVAIYDYVQPDEDRDYWWKVAGPDVERELLQAAFPDPKEGS